MKQIKIEFEWWWLWIPVFIFASIPFFRSGTTIVEGGIYASLLATSIFGVTCHPRKPRVIYSHLNTMLNHVFWTLSIGCLILIWSAFIDAGLKLRAPEWVRYIWVLTVGGGHRFGRCLFSLLVATVQPEAVGGGDGGCGD